MGGINAARHAVRNHALNASQMQSRLDRALLHYHTLLTRNKALQADIQELRCTLPFVHRERSNFFAYTFCVGTHFGHSCSQLCCICFISAAPTEYTLNLTLRYWHSTDCCCQLSGKLAGSYDSRCGLLQQQLTCAHQTRSWRDLKSMHTQEGCNKVSGMQWSQSEGTHCRWERSGFDADYGKLSQQLQTVSAEVDAVVSGIDVAQTAERHAAAETEVLKAQGDSEQVHHLHLECLTLA